MAAKHYDGLLLRLASYFPSLFFTLYYLVPDSTFLVPSLSARSTRNNPVARILYNGRFKLRDHNANAVSNNAWTILIYGILK